MPNFAAVCVVMVPAVKGARNLEHPYHKKTNGGEHQQRADCKTVRSTRTPASVNFITNFPQREAQIAMAAWQP